MIARPATGSAKLAPMPDRPSRDRPHRARCNSCGDVLESLHAWHTVACSCGGLTLAGGPDLRRVHWRAEPGASWTDLSEEPETDTGDQEIGREGEDTSEEEPGAAEHGPDPGKEPPT